MDLADFFAIDRLSEHDEETLVESAMQLQQASAQTSFPHSSVPAAFSQPAASYPQVSSLPVSFRCFSFRPAFSLSVSFQPASGYFCLQSSLRNSLPVSSENNAPAQD